MVKRACFVFYLALSAHAAAQGKVWVVDDFPGPGVDFTTLPPAIAAAAEGDTIRIKSGQYPQLVDIDGKSLALIGPEQPQVAYTAGIRVRNLAPGQTVLLRNLSSLLVPLVATDLKVLLEDNAGTVWLEDFNTLASSQPGGRVQCENCAEVVVLRGVFNGGQQPQPAPDLTGEGLVGVRSVDSSVHAYGCEFVGGSGSVSFFIPYGSGGADAFQLQGGTLFASDCTFTGGDAGIIPGSECGSGFSGDGLELTAGAASPSASTLACSFDSGEADDSCLPFYFPGQPVHVVAGAHHALQGQPCSLDVKAAVSEGGLLSVAFAGQPNAAAFLALSLVPDALFLEPFLGSLLLGQPYGVVLATVLDPAGSLQLSLPIGLLPPGADMLRFYGQLGLFLTDGTFQLCSGSAVTLLDAQF